MTQNRTEQNRTEQNRTGYNHCNRKSSFELLKVIAILFILLSSCLPYGAMYKGNYSNVYVNLSVTDLSLQGVTFTLFRYLGQVGDTLFLMCSAWFLCDSFTLKPKKCIKLILDSLVFSILGLLIATLFVKPSIFEIIKSLFPVTFQMNWFVGCYIVYYLIHPLLNNAVEDYNRKQFLAFVVILFVAYSFIATFSPKYYFTNLVAFICIHYIVSFCKKIKFMNTIKNMIYMLLSVFRFSYYL